MPALRETPFQRRDTGVLHVSRRTERVSRGGDGGRYRTRTDDLFRVKEARYQLRQSPVILKDRDPMLPDAGRRAQSTRVTRAGGHRFCARAIVG